MTQTLFSAPEDRPLFINETLPVPEPLFSKIDTTRFDVSSTLQFLPYASNNDKDLDVCVNRLAQEHEYLNRDGLYFENAQEMHTWFLDKALALGIPNSHHVVWETLRYLLDPGGDGSTRSGFTGFEQDLAREVLRELENQV